MSKAVPRPAAVPKRVVDAARFEEAALPCVSVGMPVYNGADYLECALDSLLAQDFGDFELIISDNGSKDGTETICRRYAERDPRIRYYRSDENQGASWNFGRVFELARGQYFRWACHDDTCEPSHLRCCVEVLNAAPPSVVLAYTRTVFIDEHDIAVRTSDENLETRGLPPHARMRVVAQRLRYSNVLYGLIRRDALAHTDLIRPYESSDYVLIVQLALLGEFAAIPSYLFRRRVHKAMSRKANQSATSVAQWFSASAKSAPRLAHVRLMCGYASAVAHAPLSFGERVRTSLALWYWCRRSIRPLLKEMLAVVAPGYSAYR